MATRGDRERKALLRQAKRLVKTWLATKQATDPDVRVEKAGKHYFGWQLPGGVVSLETGKPIYLLENGSIYVNLTYVETKHFWSSEVVNSGTLWTVSSINEWAASSLQVLITALNNDLASAAQATDPR